MQNQFKTAYLQFKPNTFILLSSKHCCFLLEMQIYLANNALSFNGLENTISTLIQTETPLTTSTQGSNRADISKYQTFA